MEEAMIKTDGHSYLWIQENSRKCPKCSIPIQKTEGCNKMICAMCKTIFCFRCEEIISQTDPYSHFQKGAEMEEAMIKADGHSYLWIQENSKKCPKCSIPIQKTEGCNKMICAMCKTIFCFRCEEIISQTDPYSHFQKGRCKDHLFDVPDELDNEIDDI
ncbi:zinc finger domain protein, LSD1 subclass [Oesophagostomum dentatum]|uniref:Zinc finger domain protein, LSD1 subclass n=1 Tax=Oesophagostomum dentatum TaxID=61180 RepID=A0A0B1T4V1_OESDE|nr:zinc finger domain protein, LSD1 subclass [Oesophagostomum dentatum]